MTVREQVSTGQNIHVWEIFSIQWEFLVLMNNIFHILSRFFLLLTYFKFCEKKMNKSHPKSHPCTILDLIRLPRFIWLVPAAWAISTWLSSPCPFGNPLKSDRSLGWCTSHLKPCLISQYWGLAGTLIHYTVENNWKSCSTLCPMLSQP